MHVGAFAFVAILASGYGAKANADGGGDAMVGIAKALNQTEQVGAFGLVETGFLWWRGIFFHPGINIGTTKLDDAYEFSVGGEMSIFYGNIADPLPFWLGGYVDTVYTPAANNVAFSIGPELGVSLVGVDSGVVIERHKGNWHYGVSIRPVLTIGLVSFYGRWSFMDDDRVRSEFGALFKYPLGIFD